MKIPKTIKLAGLDIEIVIIDGLHKETGMIGRAVYEKQQIELDTSFTNEQMVEQAFIHELLHWIMFIMGETELRTNEKFIDLTAHFIQQSLGPCFCECE